MAIYIPKTKKRIICLLCLWMEAPFSSLNNYYWILYLDCLINNEKNILPKMELKATPTIFGKLNTLTENKNMACKATFSWKNVYVLFSI